MADIESRLLDLVQQGAPRKGCAHARAVVITGIGLVTPLGHSMVEFGRALYGGGACIDAVVTRHASPIPGARVRADVAAGLARSETLLADRSTRLALLASSRALGDAGWHAGAPALQRCGLFVGCSSGPTESVNDSYAALHAGGRLPGLTLLRCLASGPAAAIAIRHGLRGPNQTYACACACASSSGGHRRGDAGDPPRLSRHGAGRRHRSAVRRRHHQGLGGAARAGTARRRRRRRLPPVRPQPPRHRARRRRGVLRAGSGGARAGARRCRARPHRRLCGCRATATTGPSRVRTARCRQWPRRSTTPACRPATSAASTPTAPAPASATRSKPSRSPPSSARARRPRWCARPRPRTATCSAHRGAIELAAAIVTLKHRHVPPTRNLQHPDDRCAINLVRDRPAPLPAGSAVLSNSFAFGGSNACLVVAAAGA